MAGLLSGLTILIIGASQFAHEGYLITTLHNDLMAQGATVVTYGACGTAPHAFLEPEPVHGCGTAVHIGNDPVVSTPLGKNPWSWRVTDLIHQYHPQLVLIGIADTMADYKKPTMSELFIKSEVSNLVKTISAENVGCIWLGTSWGTEGGFMGKNFARVKYLSQVISENVMPCEYIDSLKLEKPGEWTTYDGQHHTPDGYVAWAKALVPVINQSPLVQRLIQHPHADDSNGAVRVVPRP